jgi:hypothetical protein
MTSAGAAIRPYLGGKRFGPTAGKRVLGAGSRARTLHAIVQGGGLGDQLTGASSAQGVGTDHDGDWPAVSGNDRLLAASHAVEYLRERGPCFARGPRRHATIVRYCTSAYKPQPQRVASVVWRSKS